jgi:mannose-6-phosphate isomerase-like protein (cupin superfamily)
METNDRTKNTTLRRATLADAQAREPAPGQRSVTLFEHGTASIKYYAPRGVDRQTPHDQDEVYVVATGTGVFVCGDERTEFEPLDVLFVPANVPHRFEEFSDDFGTWVVFYGPKRGEQLG